jgi:hypothetical protein
MTLKLPRESSMRLHPHGARQMNAKAKPQTNVLMCVPSVRGTVMSHTMVCIARATFLLSQLGIPNDVVNIDSAEVTVARNTLASYALRVPHFTHLLFVDDDMTFDADAVIDLLRDDKPIIGYVYPKRIFDMERFYRSAQAGKSLDEASNDALEFVHRHLTTETLSVVEGKCPVAGVGMGLCMIQMSVFQTMIDKGTVNIPDFKDTGKKGGFFDGPVIGFFDPIFSDELGKFLSEDLSFCERWIKQCGGEVWARVDRKIGHIGQQIYAGNYMDRLRTGTT